MKATCTSNNSILRCSSWYLRWSFGLVYAFWFSRQLLISFLFSLLQSLRMSMSFSVLILSIHTVSNLTNSPSSSLFLVGCMCSWAVADGRVLVLMVATRVYLMAASVYVSEQVEWRLKTSFEVYLYICIFVLFLWYLFVVCMYARTRWGNVSALLSHFSG